MPIVRKKYKPNFVKIEDKNILYDYTADCNIFLNTVHSSTLVISNPFQVKYFPYSVNRIRFLINVPIESFKRLNFLLTLLFRLQ